MTLDAPLGFWTFLFSHITSCMPFVIVTVYSRMSGFDKNIIEAAKDLGATEFTVFRLVILPLKIYSMVHLGVKPEVNALCTIMFGLTLVFAMIAQILQKEK
jgi:spermidine/putrescine transport system permease protein